ncbi:MAG: MBL fold metallo-hydrolase [Clostridia bacterium]
MSLKFCSFASGSSGNSYLVKNETTALLIDAGISGKKILEGLESTQTSLDQVKGLLITHEHIDHVKSVSVLSKKIPNLSVYANEGTWSGIKKPVAPSQQRIFNTGEDFYIEGFMIRPFAIPHDAADPVGFSIYYENRQISIVTDVGHITNEIFEEITCADLLLLEANHEKEILLVGRYPYNLKQRILGDTGHLSNISAGECLCRLAAADPKPRQVLLGHLSHENNDPAVALLTVRNTLMEKNIIPGNELKLGIAMRDALSYIYEV